MIGHIYPIRGTWCKVLGTDKRDGRLWVRWAGGNTCYIEPPKMRRRK